jgi:hypothetical protein|eukprot:COSAG06_NODE_19296_length_844_cov_6.441145_1_plen_55_part_00
MPLSLHRIDRGTVLDQRLQHIVIIVLCSNHARSEAVLRHAQRPLEACLELNSSE